MSVEGKANMVTRWFIMYGFFIIGFAIPSSNGPIELFIHELGHAVFSLGTIKGWYTIAILNWFPAYIGSLISTTAAAWVIAKYGTRVFPVLGLTGVGWATRNVTQVFFEDGGEFYYDIANYTWLWYPTAIICLGVVIRAHIKEKRKWQDQQTSMGKGHGTGPQTTDRNCHFGCFSVLH